MYFQVHASISFSGVQTIPPLMSGRHALCPPGISAPPAFRSGWPVRRRRSPGISSWEGRALTVTDAERCRDTEVDLGTHRGVPRNCELFWWISHDFTSDKCEDKKFTFQRGKNPQERLGFQQKWELHQIKMDGFLTIKNWDVKPKSPPQPEMITSAACCEIWPKFCFIEHVKHVTQLWTMFNPKFKSHGSWTKL